MFYIGNISTWKGEQFSKQCPVKIAKSVQLFRSPHVTMCCWGGPGPPKILSVPHFTDNTVNRAMQIVILLRRCLYIKTTFLNLTYALYRLLFNMAGRSIFKAISSSNCRVGKLFNSPHVTMSRRWQPWTALGIGNPYIFPRDCQVSTYIIVWRGAWNLSTAHHLGALLWCQKPCG